MKRGVLTIVSLVLIGAMSLVACAPAPTPVPPTSTPAPTVAPMQSSQPTPAQSAGLALPLIDPAEYSGTIIAAGSSTVYPLTERMAELFQDEGFVGTITIDSIGTGAGFERFCVKGESDISNASRAIKDSEVQSCKSIGRDPIEFQVGIDALAIVVSNENNFVQTLSMDEVRLVFTTAEKWSDINPAWPAEPIKRFIPGTDSGTFDYFVEEVLDKKEEPLLSASNTQMSEDDNVLAQGVQGSPYAIGFFGFAYYQENKAKLRAVAIDGVEPNETTAESGEYPLARPLFLYSTAKIMKEKPQVAAFINFFLTRVNDEILDVGYFPVSQATLDNAKQRWLDAMGQ